MISLWSVIGFISSIYLISSNEPGSFLFVFGVMFAVINAGLFIWGEQ